MMTPVVIFHYCRAWDKAADCFKRPFYLLQADLLYGSFFLFKNKICHFNFAYLCFSSLSFHKLVIDNKRLSEAAASGGHVRVAVSYINCNEFCIMCTMHLRLIRLDHNLSGGLHLAHRITSPAIILIHVTAIISPTHFVIVHKDC